MSAVESMAADRHRALTHERGVPVELSSLQQRQQRKGLDAGSGMRHATSGHIEMISRQDMSRWNIEHYRRASVARHRASDRFLQRRNARLACYGWKCRHAHN